MTNLNMTLVLCSTGMFLAIVGTSIKVAFIKFQNNLGYSKKTDKNKLRIFNLSIYEASVQAVHAVIYLFIFLVSLLLGLRKTYSS